jgi:hypothetical protein
MFKRIKNERKMQIREKRKHRLVNNPEENKRKQEEKKNIKLAYNGKYFAIDSTPQPRYS